MDARRIAGAALALGLALSPSDASACGGCFHPPPNPMETVSVVAAHRMAFLSSTTESVLWDQVQYTGNPADFAWVLPVAGSPTVEVADNGFFEALSRETQITLTGPAPPPRFCADPCARWGAGTIFGSYSAPSAASDAGVAFDSGVNVLHEGVVGPYETVTIMSTSSDALVTWLHDHDYMVPTEVEPVIAYYVGLGMNFVALRLAPQAGVDRMVPVRIRAPGLSLMLPLRMIAAGAGTNVDLELFVFAESRMETATFPASEVDRAAITYDWSTNRFDYARRFEDALYTGSGVRTNWVTEYARMPDLSALAAYQSGSGADLHSAREDVGIVQHALPGAYMTRLRTRLAATELDTDLTLRAASGGDLGTSIVVTREVNRAPDPVCDVTCNLADGIEPGASAERGTGRSYRCGASPGRGGLASVLAVLGLAALALARRRR